VSQANHVIPVGVWWGSGAIGYLFGRDKSGHVWVVGVGRLGAATNESTVARTLICSARPKRFEGANANGLRLTLVEAAKVDDWLSLQNPVRSSQTSLQISGSKSEGHP